MEAYISATPDGYMLTVMNHGIHDPIEKRYSTLEACEAYCDGAGIDPVYIVSISVAI
jgi:hypothetical protein